MNIQFPYRSLTIGLSLSLCLFATTFAGITPTYLRTEYKVRPYVDETRPRLSWQLQSEGYNQYQSAYQILVASSLANLNKGIGDLWDSQKVASTQTSQVYYQGKSLVSGQKVFWKVRAWDNFAKAGQWSEASTWEMGKMQKRDWQAKWIGVDLNHLSKPGAYHLSPSPYLRKPIALEKTVKSARLYISSLGLHNFYINGEKVGNDHFASGWTDYNKRVYYRVYDVKAQLKSGQNVLGATLANGWYAGYLGYALLVGTTKVNRFYGDFPMLKAQLEITYTDGSLKLVNTDQSWKTSTGAILEADFLQGETYDARKEPTGWMAHGYQDKQWTQVREFSDKPGQEMQLHPGEPVRVVAELKAKSIKKIGTNKYIVDFGQNFAGNIRLKYRGKSGDSLVFRYGEMCYPDGSLMAENLRKARSIDTYIFKGVNSGESWSPGFTFHGFQFVEVSGLREQPGLDFLTGLALSSDLSQDGSFTTDNKMLNQLYSNIVWTQRANYIDIPTDCPQRDERLGWTGDAQVYMRSAIYNSNVAPFHKKWIQDLNDSQWANGAFPVYAPMPVDAKGIAAIRASDTFSPGWSEAGIICTYEIFRAYNDLEIVKQSLPYMLKFMAFLKTRAKDGVLKEGAFTDISPKGGFADWLSIGKKTSPDLLATLYYYYCAKLMYEMCGAIGESGQADAFKEDASVIQGAFKKHYMGDDSQLKTDVAVYGKGEGYVDGKNGFSGHTQTAYANALYFGILEGEDLRKAGIYLRQLVEANDDKLTTGFLGFKPLLPALSGSGSIDKAYKLALSTQYPSLGYEVVNGATSIWERWDSYIKGKGFVHNAAMNSFSHYAFGSVNEWFFENVAGIKMIDRGYQTFRIAPEIPGAEHDLNRIKASYRSISGLIGSEWDYSGNEKIHRLEIPVNTTAYFQLRTSGLENVYINEIPLSKSKLVQAVERKTEGLVLKLGSGKYQIKLK